MTPEPTSLPPLPPELRELLHSLPRDNAAELAPRVAARLRGEVPRAARPWGRPRWGRISLAGGIAAVGVAGVLTLARTPAPARSTPPPAGLSAAPTERSALSAKGPSPGDAAQGQSADDAPSGVAAAEEAADKVRAQVPADGAPAAESVEADPVGNSPPSAQQKASRKARATAPAAGPHPLYAAATALRKENDPARALSLLRAAEQSTPALRGTEEVLALTLEAESRLGSPRAASLARSYLTRFPQGRYRTLAEQVLRR